MSFERCCIECLNNDDLVNEFCRLRGIKLPEKRGPNRNSDRPSVWV